MSKTIKYIGTARRWPELAITGKQSIWLLGQTEQRGDTEAAQLLATGLFSDVDATQLPEQKVVQISSVVSGAGNIVLYADREYAGAAPANATAHLQALFDSASAAYSVALGRAKVVVPRGFWTIDFLQWRENVEYEFTGAFFLQSLTQAFPGRVMFESQRFETSGSYYGHNRNIKITGGTAVSNGYAGGSTIVQMDEFEDSDIHGFGVWHATGRNNWAWRVSGRNVRIIDPSVRFGAAVYQDGLHFIHGSNLSVVGGRIDSGDDAIVGGMDIVSLTQQYDDEALDGLTVTGTIINSLCGNGIRAYYGGDTVAMGGSLRRRVKNFITRGITGTAGVLRNSGISLVDVSASANTDNSVLENIDIQSNLRIGSAAHDGVNPYGVWVQVGQNIKIDAAITLTDSTGVATRFRPLYVAGCNGGEVSLRQTGAVARASIIAAVAATSVISDFAVRRSDIQAGSVDGVSGIDISNAAGGTMRNVRVEDNVIRNVRDAAYAVLTGATGVIASLYVNRNKVYKLVGSTTGRSYATGSATSVSYLEMVGNDFSDTANASLGSFNTQHAAYSVRDNINFTSRVGGTATITAAATTIAVVHGLGVRLAGATSASIPQITVVPTNAPTNAIKWSVSVSADTGFSINADVAPGASTATFAWSVDTSKKPV